MGRYLREWGADIICLQETMSSQVDQHFWTVLGWGTSWNVRDLWDDRRRGIVGRYLREWGADIICLQETMSSQVDQHF